MKTRGHLFILAAVLLAPLAGLAQALTWQGVEHIQAGDRISVRTDETTVCNFQRATDDTLYCEIKPRYDRPQSAGHSFEFRREDVVEVRFDREDRSKWFLSMIAGGGGGGGWDFQQQPNAFFGAKLGGTFTLDLQYDRIQGHNGFSTEGSAVIPVFRLPQFDPSREKKFVKIYAEPGVGYRAGDGPFGGYSSAKVLAVLLNDKWPDNWASPYVEYQRRFPFSAPLQGDNRITVGVMVALCAKCQDGN